MVNLGVGCPVLAVQVKNSSTRRAVGRRGVGQSTQVASDPQALCHTLAPFWSGPHHQNLDHAVYQSLKSSGAVAELSGFLKNHLQRLSSLSSDEDNALSIVLSETTHLLSVRSRRPPAILALHRTHLLHMPAGSAVPLRALDSLALLPHPRDEPYLAG